MATVDADAHVVEIEHTWDYMDPSERRFRPILVDMDGGKSRALRKAWLIDGRLCSPFTQTEITEEDLASMWNALGVQR